MSTIYDWFPIEAILGLWNGDRNLVVENVTLDGTLNHCTFTTLTKPFLVTLLVLCALRLLVETIAKRIGEKYLHIKPTTTTSYPKLEELYLQSNSGKNPSDREIESIRRSHPQLTSKFIQSWFRRRYNRDLKSKINRFVDSAWKCFIYTAYFIYGVHLANKYRWYQDTTLLHTDYGKEAPTDIRNFCAAQLALYIQFVVFQFTDIRRKDFWQMFVHHIVTLTLMAGSYRIGHVNVFLYVTVVHDASDPLLEITKLTNQLKLPVIPGISFVALVVTWTYTRLYLLPFYVCPAAVFLSKDMGTTTPIVRLVLGGLLYILVLMHIRWWLMLVRTGYRVLLQNKLTDDRSDSEGTDMDEPVQDMNHNAANVADDTNGNVVDGKSPEDDTKKAQ